jgi:outer membrane protein TolC
VALLYNQSLAADSRLAAIQTQAATAEALDHLAQDQKAAGLVAGIDVLRQDVLLESAKQRVVSASNDAEKARLRLARAIGLPLGQQFTLTGALAYSAVPPMTVDAAVAEAYAQREDLKSAEERTKAADAAVRSATFSRLPTIHFNAAYGKIGNSASDVLGTYSAAAVLRVPLFDGSAAKARTLRATADLTARKADLDDEHAGVYYEVRTALLDLGAADAAVQLAGHGRDLANLQLTQARDRFAAGVASTIELAQAQESVATADDNYIATLFAHVVAKAALARALGTPEAALTQYLGGHK